MKAEAFQAVMVLDLLLAHRATDGDETRWLAAIIARRSMEPSDLWEDLGLQDPSELTRMLVRHFAPLASLNLMNMEWKRFFFHFLAEDAGLVMCGMPVCSRCGDFDVCFGEEPTDSSLAYRRRVLAMTVASFSDHDAEPSPLFQ